MSISFHHANIQKSNQVQRECLVNFETDSELQIEKQYSFTESSFENSNQQVAMTGGIFSQLNGDESNASLPNMDLNVVVMPGEQRLEAKVVIQIPTSQLERTPIMWLGDAMQIETISINGNLVQFDKKNTEDYPLPYAEATPYQLMIPEFNAETENFNFIIKYSGVLPLQKSIGGISETDIELALYSAWFPKIQGVEEFTHDLRLTIPEGFQAVSNSALIDHDIDEKNVYHWQDTDRDVLEDINVVASNQFECLSAPINDSLSLNVYSSSEDKKTASFIKENALRFLATYIEKFGPLNIDSDKIDIVFSSRKGQSYTRTPLIVLSESHLNTKNKFKSLMVLAHEIAHFWWSLSDPCTTDFWINEGLAQYSALMVLEDMLGPKSVAKMYSRSLQNITLSPLDKAAIDILPEENSILGMEYGLFAFSQLHKIMGDQFFNFLREIYDIGQSRNVTNDDIICLVEKHGGAEASLVFEDWMMQNSKIPGIKTVSTNFQKEKDLYKTEITLNVITSNDQPVCVPVTLKGRWGAVEEHDVLVSQGLNLYELESGFKPISIEINTSHSMPLLVDKELDDFMFMFFAKLTFKKPITYTGDISDLNDFNGKVTQAEIDAGYRFLEDLEQMGAEPISIDFKRGTLQRLSGDNNTAYNAFSKIIDQIESGEVEDVATHIGPFQLSLLCQALLEKAKTAEALGRQDEAITIYERILETKKLSWRIFHRDVKKRLEEISQTE